MEQKVTKKVLKQWYDEINTLYFDGMLPPAKLEVARTNIGMGRIWYPQPAFETPACILVNIRLVSSLKRGTLIHEMTHLKLWLKDNRVRYHTKVEDQKEFDAEMRRLAALGALDGTR